MDGDVFKQMFSTFLTPEIQGCLSAIDSVAGFKLSESDRKPFLYFHKYITDPQPRFITDWRSDKKLEKWYHRLVNGVLGDTQNTFACIVYHYERLCNIEKSVMELVEQYDYKKVLGNSTMALGNTLVWDFEYQAFILAFRRCLDYLARALCCYFRNEFHSFRQLGEFLKKQKPADITQPIIAAHEKYLELFDFVLSDGERKSLRDIISHYEYVGVGCINLSQRGFVLVGGGEELAISGPNETVLLSDVLDGHMSNMRACINEILVTYVDTLRSKGV